MTADDGSDVLGRLTGLAMAVLPAWAITPCEVRLCKHRENAVFCVAASDEQSYVLRLHRAGYHTDRQLHSELAWIEALAGHGVSVPRIIKTIDGSLNTTIRHPETPTGHVVADLFEWVDAEPLAMGQNPDDDVDLVVENFGKLGEVIALIHNQASVWQHPPDFERSAWDTDGFTGAAPLWGRFHESTRLTPAQRQLLEKAEARIRAGLQEYADRDGRLTYSMVHADLIAGNVLLRPDGELHVIDFDDAGFGWQLFDIATALYFISDQHYFDRARSALLSGYQLRRATPARILEDLPLFLAARGLTYVAWVSTRAETDTARDQGDELIHRACDAASSYLNTRQT